MYNCYIAIYSPAKGPLTAHRSYIYGESLAQRRWQGPSELVVVENPAPAPTCITSM